MKLVFAGTPEVAVPSLATLLDSEHEVLAVITQPPAKSGRGREVRPSPVQEFARDQGIEILHPDSIKEIASVLIDLKPDAIPVVAYGQLIPQSMLDIPPLGWINVHFSLLPDWRGAAPVQHSIWHGDSITGATTFRIDAGMDSGPVLGHLTQPIDPKATSGELLTSLANAGAQLLKVTIDALEAGEITAVPQQHDLATFAPKITKLDALIDWRSPAIEIDRRIRAMTPKPGAWTRFTVGDAEQSLVLAPVSIDRDVQLEPGTLSVEGRRVLVGSATYALELTHVKPAGKKFMNSMDWVRGLRTEVVRFF